MNHTNDLSFWSPLNTEHTRPLYLRVQLNAEKHPLHSERLDLAHKSLEQAYQRHEIKKNELFHKARRELNKFSFLKFHEHMDFVAYNVFLNRFTNAVIETQEIPNVSDWIADPSDSLTLTSTGSFSTIRPFLFRSFDISYDQQNSEHKAAYEMLVIANEKNEISNELLIEAARWLKSIVDERVHSLTTLDEYAKLLYDFTQNVISEQRIPDMSIEQIIPDTAFK